MAFVNFVIIYLALFFCIVSLSVIGRECFVVFRIVLLYTLVCPILSISMEASFLPIFSLFPFNFSIFDKTNFHILEH